MNAIVLVALAVVASASAGAIVAPGPGIDYYARPAYTTSYSVVDPVTGDKKSAGETRDGDVTKGTYSVVQSDGVLRTVNYVVTPLGGFQAQVLNNGIQVYPPTGAVAPVAIAAPALAVARGPVAVAGPGIGQKVIVGATVDNLDVQISRAAHLLEHQRQTNNHLVSLAAANSRYIGAPAVAVQANGLGLGGAGWGW